jgi:hypothetical protein
VDELNEEAVALFDRDEDPGIGIWSQTQRDCQ